MAGIDLKGNPHRAATSFWTSRAFLIFLAFGAMAIVLLWSEHRAHLLGVLPYLFLLACPRCTSSEVMAHVALVAGIEEILPIASEASHE